MGQDRLVVNLRTVTIEVTPLSSLPSDQRKEWNQEKVGTFSPYYKLNVMIKKGGSDNFPGKVI